LAGRRDFPNRAAARSWPSAPASRPDHGYVAGLSAYHHPAPASSAEASASVNASLQTVIRASAIAVEQVAVYAVKSSGDSAQAEPQLADRFVYAKLSVVSLMAVSEAAERLRVSTRQVQHLVARGELRQLARGVIDETSVERLLAVRQGSHKRAWSEATAWGAVSLLSGGDAEWMGETQRSRLRSRLRGLSATELVERARQRADVTRYRAHSSAGRHLLGILVYATNVAGRLGLAETNDVDGYIAAADVASVVRNHGLIRDDEGPVTLRATTMDLGIVRGLANRSVVLAGLDLAESLDTRERRAGLDALDRALEAFRG
jgi:hypothetical protein